MKAVFADPVLFVPGIGHAVDIRIVWKGGVERGFEEANQWETGVEVLENADGLDIGRVVRGGQIVVVCHALQNIFVEKMGSWFAAHMDGFETNGVQACGFLQGSVGGQGFDDVSDGCGIVWNRARILNVFVANAVFNRGFRTANALNATLGQDGFVGQVEEFVFERGATCVGDEDFHRARIVKSVSRKGAKTQRGNRRCCRGFRRGRPLCLPGLWGRFLWRPPGGEGGQPCFWSSAMTRRVISEMSSS